MKNVIITGSSNGFGLKAAKDFADKGNKVFATMRNPNGKNANAKAELEAHSPNIKVVDMDVTNDASVKEAMSTILAVAGNIDVLINNAGIMFIGITEAFSVEQAKFKMETNYFGAIRWMQAVLPAMQSFRFNYQLFFFGWFHHGTIFFHLCRILNMHWRLLFKVFVIMFFLLE
ncbi:MAG: SDR family NAD(P)-dependent oxidoreductase [Saprospiraceae bacterium]